MLTGEEWARVGTCCIVKALSVEDTLKMMPREFQGAWGWGGEMV